MSKLQLWVSRICYGYMLLIMIAFFIGAVVAAFTGAEIYVVMPIIALIVPATIAIIGHAIWNFVLPIFVALWIGMIDPRKLEK